MVLLLICIKLMKLIFKNKVIWYTFTRYFTYSIQFIGALLIAKYLGPYYLGGWGFITLIIQYLAKFNFGIANSVNAIASIHKYDSKYVGEVVGVGISLLLVLALLIVLFFLGAYSLGVDIGAKYAFMQYVPYVIVIAILTHFNLFFSNVFRVYGKLLAISFSQSVLPISLLIVAFFYKGEELLFALVITNLLALLVSFIFFVSTSPVSFKPILNLGLAKKIQIKGFYLFVYNASFYLIIITTRTFISEFYSVVEFGYFTFAYTLAYAVLLLFEAMSFLILPKLLNRFSSSNDEKASQLLNMLRDSYVTISHCCIHLVIFMYPVLLFFFPAYEQTARAFVFIGLTVVIYTNSFGFQGLIIAKEKEKTISLIAFSALILNIFFNLILILVFKVGFEYVIIATMVTYFIYVYTLTKYGRKMIALNNSFFATFKDAFPIRWMLPFILSLVIAFYFYDIRWIYIIPVILFVILNSKGLLNSYRLAQKIISNPKITDI